MELIECLMHTGNSPWCAAGGADRHEEASTVHLVADNISEPVRHAPAVWPALLQDVADDTMALQRLAAACRPALLCHLRARAPLDNYLGSNFGSGSNGDSALHALLELASNDALQAASKRRLTGAGTGDVKVASGDVGAGPNAMAISGSAGPATRPATSADARTKRPAPAPESPPQNHHGLPSVRASMPRTRRSALDRPAGLHLDDAGLAIRWAVVVHLFRIVGLPTEVDEFPDDESRMSGVALLTQLAFNMPEPPEYDLPLAKLLCGLSPTAPYLLDKLPTPAQRDKCTRLLEASITHAGVRREMPGAIFRDIFLRRAAVASVQNGARMMQAERQSHDVLLDHSPWS